MDVALLIAPSVLIPHSFLSKRLSGLGPGPADGCSVPMETLYKRQGGRGATVGSGAGSA